jgi:hypothetical protein
MKNYKIQNNKNIKIIIRYSTGKCRHVKWQSIIYYIQRKLNYCYLYCCVLTQYSAGEIVSRVYTYRCAVYKCVYCICICISTCLLKNTLFTYHSFTFLFSTTIKPNAWICFVYWIFLKMSWVCLQCCNCNTFTIVFMFMFMFKIYVCMNNIYVVLYETIYRIGNKVLVRGWYAVNLCVAGSSARNEWLVRRCSVVK